MTKRYQIKGIKGSWLHQPGMMVYVEKEYDEPVNDVIKQYHDALSEWCTKNGLIFLYIPKFYRYENWKWYTFMTGKKAYELPYETTSIVLKHSLSEASLQQIEGPSLVFTSNENDELLAYRIEGNGEKTIEDSLLNILSDYLQDSGNPVDAWMDEWLDPLITLISSKRIDSRMDERIRFTEEDYKRFLEIQAAEEEAEAEEELRRQQEKAAILAKQKADREASEAERSRIAKCEELIQEAISLKNEEKYSQALKTLKKASAMDIPAKEEAIKAIKDEIEELKNKNSYASRFGNWLNTILDEDRVEEHTGATKEYYAPKADDIRFRIPREKQEEKELPRPRCCETANKCLYSSEEPPEYARQNQLREDSPIDTHQLNEALHIIAKFLRMGYTKETIWAMIEPFQELSPIHITKDLRIKLPLYDKEIELPPVQKAVFLLFLKHPEGIYFKNLISHHTELYQLYRKLAIRGSSINHATTVMDLVNPLSNSMNEKCSQIKKRIQAILDDSLAKHYYISGAKGELKRIDINPDMIVWE